MSIPKVAIVGRPNVGKSSLLNWLSGRLISVVDPTAGVTRDRVTWIMHEGDRYFELVDTGGIGIVDSDELAHDIEHQVHKGIRESDVVLMVVDARTGLTPLDEDVAARVHREGKPMLLCVNKCDSPRLEADADNFLTLADVPLVTTSVKAGSGRQALLDAILRLLPPRTDEESMEGDRLLSPADLRLAVVGRRNVGKSTFINQLAESDRVIVSEVAGTTRDSIDIRFEMDDRCFVAIDTPGVRKRKSLANDIEFYGLVRAQRSIRRADLVLMFFDATRTISRVDKQLVDEISRHHKPCVFVVNKWDLALDEGMTSEKWANYLIRSFGSMRHVPIAFLTAKDGRNIRKLINLTQSVWKQANRRLTTGLLNRLLRQALEKNPPPIRRNRRPKIYFGSQVDCVPPTIVLKCNEPALFDESWKRYLLGFLRETTPFEEVPIRVFYRARDEKDDLPAGRPAGPRERGQDADDDLLSQPEWADDSPDDTESSDADAPVSQDAPLQDIVTESRITDARESD